VNPGKLSTSWSEATLERTPQYAIQIADVLSWILVWPSCKLRTHRPTSQPSPQNRPTSLQQDIFWKPVDGSGEAEVLTTSAYTQVPTSWSHNGVLSYAEGPLGQRDFWVLSLEGDRNHNRYSPLSSMNAIQSSRQMVSGLYSLPISQAETKFVRNLIQVRVNGSRWPFLMAEDLLSSLLLSLAPS